MTTTTCGLRVTGISGREASIHRKRRMHGAMEGARRASWLMLSCIQKIYRRFDTLRRMMTSIGTLNQF
ncbi:hypothetical protein GUJ93_ZPchr0001g29377 [Zizania palustris]|uniref:Uncharacterized protein n=1 Tax=Zizania palustris TaxID=103762 RepID=A0A8J5RXG4_ZIZPA|nr:hypothetical protein GUJ93_ZPchr0001g29377 [Zizania palustris]